MGTGSQRLYAVLGIDALADEVSIRRAYKLLTDVDKLAREAGDPRAEARFQVIRQAYEVLIDRDRRALYDEFGAASLKANFDPEKARRAIEREKREAERRALAALVVPTAVPANTPQTGRTQWSITVAIGKTLARKGGRLTTKVKRPVPCPRCDGSGRLEKTCKTCGGAKQVIARRLDACEPCHGLGVAGERVPCRRCRGSGRRGKSDCRACDGGGRLVKRRDCPACEGRGIRVHRYEKPCESCRTSGRETCPRCEGKGTVPKPVSMKLRVPRGAQASVAYRYAGAGFSGDSDAPSDLLVTFAILARAPARRRRRAW